MWLLSLCVAAFLGTASVQASALPAWGSRADTEKHSVRDTATVDTNSISSLLPRRKVAIIGAGAGGTSAAYYLHKYLNGCSLVPKVDITIFERRTYIGGRSQTTNAFGNSAYPVEMGGSVFIQRNTVLVALAAELNIPIIVDPGRPQAFPTPFPDDPTANVSSRSMWDGEDFVFQYSTTADLIARYGAVIPTTVAGMAADVAAQVLNIYNSTNFPFTNLKTTIRKLGMTSMLSQTGKDWFVSTGLWINYAWEWVQFLTRSNYLQDLNKIHAYGASIALSVTDGRIIQGGIWQLYSAMATASGATVKLNTQVTTINKVGSKFSITWTDHATSVTTTALYDSLIIASPYHQTNIVFGPGVINTVPINAPFVELHSTAFSTHVPRFNGSFFARPVNTLVPYSIFSILPAACNGIASGADCTVNNQNFNKFHAITPVGRAINPATNQEQFVWKVFSQVRPSAEFFTELLGETDVHTPVDENDDPPGLDWVDRWDWLAYPYLTPRTEFDPIRLDSGSSWSGSVWYPNAIELFGSVMEFSALSGKNVARNLAKLMTPFSHTCLGPV